MKRKQNIKIVQCHLLFIFDKLVVLLIKRMGTIKMKPSIVQKKQKRISLLTYFASIVLMRVSSHLDSRITGK